MLLELMKTGQEPVSINNLNDTTLQELQVQGIVTLPTPSTAHLTYAGAMLAGVLDEAIQQGLTKPVSEWKEGYRWIGSEVIAMLDAAMTAESIPEATWDALHERGLASEEKDPDTKVVKKVVNQAGQAVLEVYFMLEPELSINKELAEYIKKAPEGPTEAIHLPVASNQKELLEAMRLIAYSVPSGEVVTFTGLGQAVKKVLDLGVTREEGDIITASILESVARVADGNEISPEALVTLEELNLVINGEELTLAGEAALDAWRLYKDQTEQSLRTIAVSEPEMELLLTIDKLHEKYANDPNRLVDINEIHRELVERQIAKFEKIAEEYGRYLDTIPKRKGRILKAFLETKDKVRWFEDNFNLREMLYALEAFDLIFESTSDNGHTVFNLTEHGKQVVKDQKEYTRQVSSTGLKTLMHANELFLAPNIEWVKRAREEKLLGEFEATKSGRFYEQLASEIERLPFMTALGAEILKQIGSKGTSVDELLSSYTDPLHKEEVRWALEQLEAFGWVEVLADGNIVETPAGKLVDMALSGVPSGFGAPLNPTIYRVIKAISEVGTLYVKERKIRMQPKHLKQAIKLSGLSDEAFNKAYTAAREAHYVGKNSVNEAGLYILEAVEQLNQ
jgi:hypothetical protein